MELSTQSKPPAKVTIDGKPCEFHLMRMADWSALSRKMPTSDGAAPFMHRVLAWSYTPEGMMAMLRQQYSGKPPLDELADFGQASKVQELADLVRDYGDDDDPKSGTGS